MIVDIITQQIASALERDRQDRLEHIKRAWDAYYGHFPKPLTVKPGQADDNVLVNYARVVVDKGVSFLFGQDIAFEISATERTEAEEWLDACWLANRRGTLLQKLALNGALCGHAFAKILPGQPYPRVVVLDPATVSVRWEPDDIEAVVGYTIEYPAVDPDTGKPMSVRQIIERDGAVWRLVDQRSIPGSQRWSTVAEQVWPHDWPPVVDCQNAPAPNEYWGIGDLEEDVLQLNQGINFVLSNLARIIRYHAHPKTWGKGFLAGQLKVGVDETIILPNADAELHNLEMVTDLSSSISLYERLREALHEVTRVPEVATGKLDRAGALSGVALQILYQPLLEKTEAKRRTYGDLVVELNRRLLALGGFGEDIRTAITWPALLPVDTLQEAQTLLLHQQLGVSQDTILERAGYDADIERERREAGSAQMGEQLLTAFDRGE